MTPFPPDGGAEIRSFHLMRLLAERYDVTALCFWRPGDSAQTARERLAGLNQIDGVEAVGIPRHRGPGGALLSHLRSVIAGRVYTAFTVDSRQYRDALKRLLGRRVFDIIHVDTLDLGAFLDALPRQRVACGHHNVESALLRRRAEGERSAFRRAYIRYQARLMECEERRWCPTFALNVVVSEWDAELLSSIAPSCRRAVVPNGVDTRFFLPSGVAGTGLVFVGGTKWFPNRDALDYFAGEILPLIRSTGSIRSVWVGHADPAARAAGEHAGITMTGFVDDIRPHVHGAACFIAPLRVGGGTRLKILDAWAMGKAVVSTSIGCEGLDARDGWNILIRDDPHAFAEAVRQVLANQSLRTELGANARQTAERSYSWDVIGEAMYAEYEAIRLGGTQTAAAGPATTTVP